MKIKQIPVFQKWLAVLKHMDDRLSAADFNRLFGLFRKG